MSVSSIHRSLFLCCSAFAVAACSNLEFSHVVPGQSARKLIGGQDAPATTQITSTAELPPGAFPTLAGEPLPPLPAGKVSATQPPLIPLQLSALPDIPPAPALPASNEAANKVADAYTRGSVAMQAGSNAEAIAGLEEAVKLDPNLSDAWSKLVVVYTREGDMAKATAAYKKAKALGQQNGPESAGGGLIPLP